MHFFLGKNIFHSFFDCSFSFFPRCIGEIKCFRMYLFLHDHVFEKRQIGICIPICYQSPINLYVIYKKKTIKKPKQFILWNICYIYFSCLYRVINYDRVFQSSLSFLFIALYFLHAWLIVIISTRALHRCICKFKSFKNNAIYQKNSVVNFRDSFGKYNVAI